MNYAANFIDKYSEQSTAAIFHKREIKELATTLMKEYKLEIHENPEHWSHANEKHIHKYIYNKQIILKLLEATIEDIDQLFNGTELKTLDKLQEIKIKINRKTYINLKKEVYKPNKAVIKDNILKKINKYPE